MKILILFIILISSQSFAFECNESHTSTALPLTDLHEYANQLQEKINWFSATDKDVDNAKCVDDEDFSDQAISNYLNSFGPEKVTATVKGLEITDHPRKIELLRKLTKPSITKDEEVVIPDDAKSCLNVECVTSSMFGDQSSNYLFLLDKYGLNLNSDRRNHTAKWNKEEIQSIMQTLNYIPKQLIPYDTNKTFVRGERFNNGGGTYANATIYFYDLHFTQTPQMQTYTVFHEMGHNIAATLDLDDSQKWKEISDWSPEYELDEQKKPVKNFYGLPQVKDWHAGHSHKMSSKYAKTNPAEDFAETFSAYRFNPEKLKEISPEKYNYMKNYIYQGAEYLTDESCKKEATLPYKLFNKQDAKMPEKITDFSVCKSSIASLVKNEISQKLLVECTKNLMAQSSIKKAIKNKELKLDEVERLSILNSSQLPIDSINPSPDDITKTKKILTEEIMNSSIKNFNAYSSCDDRKKHLYLQLEQIDNKITEPQFMYSQKESINDGLLAICKEHEKVKSFKCSDYLYKLSIKESKLKNNLCDLGSDKYISCNDDISNFKSESHKSAFKQLCSSPNLTSSSSMSCNRNTRAIFAKLIGLNEDDISKESTYPDGRCKL